MTENTTSAQATAARQTQVTTEVNACHHFRGHNKMLAHVAETGTCDLWCQHSQAHSGMQSAASLSRTIVGMCGSHTVTVQERTVGHTSPLCPLRFSVHVGHTEQRVCVFPNSCILTL